MNLTGYRKCSNIIVSLLAYVAGSVLINSIDKMPSEGRSPVRASNSSTLPAYGGSFFKASFSHGII